MIQQPLFHLEDVKSNKQSQFSEMIYALSVERSAAWPDQFGESLKKYLIEKDHQPIPTLSLFSGGGGLDIAFHDAGFGIAEMIELEEKYVKTLKENAKQDGFLEGTKSICIDIKNYQPTPGLNADFIIGGPPCQTFSAAGRRAAGVSGTSDPRGTLFEEYVRVLQELQPKGFLFENVYGIIGAQGGKPWEEIQQAFKSAGYTIYSRILDTADYGVPQHRERLIIVGLRQGEFLFPYPTHGPDSIGKEPYYSAGMAVAGANVSEATEGLGGQYGHLLEEIPPGLNYSFYTEKMGHPRPVFGWRTKFSDFLYKADPDTPVRTIKAQGGQYTGPFSWENRAFTIAELKRLQTFPDAFKIVGNRQISIEQIGNSVPPQMARVLALSILDQVFGVNLPFKMAYMPHEKELGFRKRKRQLTSIYQKKAREAISNLDRNMTDISPSEMSGTDVRHISSEFHWTKGKMASSIALKIVYSLNPHDWKIIASTYAEDTPNEDYKIEITPATGNEWSLPTKKLILVGSSSHEQVFTALWKALEEKVLKVTGVADLVQLNGYYQYSPKLSAKMTFLNLTLVQPHWQALQLIVQGIGVAQQLTEDQFATLLQLHPEEIGRSFQKLRGIGYEIRNNNTNPQINAGEYLIPYAFPTLNPRSVQLKKSLGAISEQ